MDFITWISLQNKNEKVFESHRLRHKWHSMQWFVGFNLKIMVNIVNIKSNTTKLQIWCYFEIYMLGGIPPTAVQRQKSRWRLL